MKPGSPELERLISRYLDDEATRAERRELRRLERSDPTAAALVDEYATLDREIGRALRTALGRSYPLPARHAPWWRIGELVAVAAAACLMAMVWMNTSRVTSPPGGNGRVQAASSWFAPPAAQADRFEPLPDSYERPRQRLRDTDLDWILIPGDRPGEFMVIEVNRARTRAIAIQDDF